MSLADLTELRKLLEPVRPEQPLTLDPPKSLRCRSDFHRFVAIDGGAGQLCLRCGASCAIVEARRADLARVTVHHNG